MSAKDVVTHALNQYYSDSADPKYVVNLLLAEYRDDLLSRLADELREACEQNSRMTVWDIANMIDPEE